jgi:SnoaL-like domain
MLMRDQWRHVWDATEGFRFHLEGARIEIEGISRMRRRAGRPQASWRTGRPSHLLGRATIVLRRGKDGWRAVHTHFSLSPGETEVVVVGQARRSLPLSRCRSDPTPAAKLPRTVMPHPAIPSAYP